MFYTKNTITQKNLMTLTSLFLGFFLMIHLLGNFQLLLPKGAAQIQFNAYGKFLDDFMLIKIVSYVLYACILGHTIVGIYLSIKSKKTNEEKNIVKNKSTWKYRNSIFLISIVLFLLIMFSIDFWYQFKFGEVPLDIEGNKDVYALVINAFTKWWYVVFYQITILTLLFHLLNDIFNAHKSMGFNKPIYAKLVNFIGVIFTIVIAIGYLIVPIFIYNQ